MNLFWLYFRTLNYLNPFLKNNCMALGLAQSIGLGIEDAIEELVGSPEQTVALVAATLAADAAVAKTPVLLPVLLGVFAYEMGSIAISDRSMYVIYYRWWKLFCQ